MNYVEAFIAVADDCPVDRGIVPETKAGRKPTVAAIQYSLLKDAPYAHTQEDVLFLTHARSQAIPPEELAARGEELRAAFFAKPQACLRASPLAKQYGWGFHFDAHGRVALYPCESDEYQALAGNTSGALKVMKALRSRRA